jgi:hypothetical protein
MLFCVLRWHIANGQIPNAKIPAALQGSMKFNFSGSRQILSDKKDAELIDTA